MLRNFLMKHYDEIYLQCHLFPYYQVSETQGIKQLECIFGAANIALQIGADARSGKAVRV